MLFISNNIYSMSHHCYGGTSEIRDDEKNAFKESLLIIVTNSGTIRRVVMMKCVNTYQIVFVNKLAWDFAAQNFAEDGVLRRCGSLGFLHFVSHLFSIPYRLSAYVEGYRY